MPLTPRLEVKIIQQVDWQPGPPIGLSPVTVAVDRHVARRMQCSECGQTDLAFQAEHTASGRYRGLGICRHCGTEHVI